MNAALGHNRPPSYREIYHRGHHDLEFGQDYRNREFCVRGYDDYFDGHLTYRDGGWHRYKNLITIIRLIDGTKCFVPKHAAYSGGYKNSDEFARERLGLPPKNSWRAAR